MCLRHILYAVMGCVSEVVSDVACVTGCPFTHVVQVVSRAGGADCPWYVRVCVERGRLRMCGSVLKIL